MEALPEFELLSPATLGEVGNVLFSDGTIEEIRRINSKADSNSITIYNSFQGNYTPIVPEKWAVSERSSILQDNQVILLFLQLVIH